MKIQYLSDLHFEFPNNKVWLKENPIEPKGDILLVAGDTFHLGKDFANPWLFDELSEKFKQVFLIPGNHEYYAGFDIAQTKEKFHIEVRPNVNLFHNHAFELDEVYFIFSTLWSKIEKYTAEVYKGLYDFRLIKYEGKPFSVNHFNELFESSFDFLQKAISEKKAEKCVVMTHHLPSDLCNSKEFEGSTLNEGFCVDLTEWIKKQPIDFWIYGHSHRNKDHFKIGETHMLTNQLGYVGLSEHWMFKRNAVFNI